MPEIYDGPDRRILMTDYEGVERRTYSTCDACKYTSTIHALKDSVDELYGVMSIGRKEFDQCKTKVDMDITTLHADMASLRSDVSTMRNDMHALTIAVGDMRGSLAEIAGSLKSLADFPETWQKLKGWWAVMRWLKENWLLLVVILGLFAWMTWTSVKDFIPV